MRALLIVLDSVGIGHAPDAKKYGDEGANTLGHIFARVPGLKLPNLCALGLPKILDANYSWGRKRSGLPHFASFGKMQERSVGKDTTTGHWEIAGVIVDVPFTVFEKFPYELVRAIERDAGVRFIGNFAGSGTMILDDLGAEHVAQHQREDIGIGTAAEPAHGEGRGEHVVERCGEAVLRSPGKVVVIVLPGRPVSITDEVLGVVLVAAK